MAGTYIKVNRKVAESAGLHKDRPELPDGNYALWFGDIDRFGPRAEAPDILVRIGGVILSGREVRAEQTRDACVPLPEPAEARYRMEPESTEDSGADGGEEPETPGESDGAQDPEEGDEA